MEVLEWNVTDEDCINTRTLIESALQFKQKPYTGTRIIRTPCVSERSKYFLYAALVAAGVPFDIVSTIDDENHVDWDHVEQTKNVLAVDVDDTLVCFRSGRIKENVIETVNELYDNGWLVVIYTSRSTVYYEETRKLLDELGVRYDFLVMKKFFAHVYVDDVKDQIIHPDEVSITRVKLLNLHSKLKRAWSQETAYEKSDPPYSDDRPCAGQCFVTSLVVCDVFGGWILYNRMLKHYFNLLPDGTVVDFTYGQFVGECRPYFGSKEDLKRKDSKELFAYSRKMRKETIMRRAPKSALRRYEELKHRL